LRLPYVVSIDFWQYKVEVEVKKFMLHLESNIFKNGIAMSENTIFYDHKQ